ncbi:hypothetical protein EIP91_007278 [Steccherinum ochraceum]|uniref:FAR-17a/AIG1-like protein n=1 Tax=Steccherinum ochraceum TaxID=92696 RepID=A0A4R0R4B9_9APHY|nr:hypothetical protein EIP91_007278 [Steccherinum ochraceum]
MSKGGIWRVLGLPTTFDVDHGFVTSPLLSPLMLAVIRLTLAVYTLITFMVDLAWTSTHLPPNPEPSDKVAAEFSYFTKLSYIGLIAYFWASGVQSAVYAGSRERSYPLQRWPRILQFLHMLLYSTITTFPILVTIVYWAVLSSSQTFSTPFSAWSNISEHALNTVFALFEILLTHTTPMPWIHILFLDLMLAGYLGVAYITHVTEGFYTYDFLDPHKQGSLLAAYIVGIGAGEIVLFIIIHYVIVLRTRLSRRSQQPPEPPGPTEAIDDWEEITAV